MKHGIYYAYWEKEWQADYIYYVNKASKIGFDILEIAATPLPDYSDLKLAQLRASATENELILTCGHGPSFDQNLASSDPDIVKNAKTYYIKLFDILSKLDIHVIGGGIYSYWPVDYSKPIDKQGDWFRAVENVREVAKVARELGIDYCLEVLNRFEGYLLNTADEAVEFVEQVGLDNVKIMLDTFHMNIEETSIGGAIRKAGSRLGHFHTGECNRNVPGRGRVPWTEIAEALKDINYSGAAVMEPFVLQGGQIGQDIKVWRSIVDQNDEASLDKAVADALRFSKYILG
jgi:D-psicose/D-tagatose/L-ribulose 3-epimerase